MRSLLLAILFIILLVNVAEAQDQVIQDDFEGNGTINTWTGDDCGINTIKTNPFPNDINSSATVLEYSDTGGQYANVRFEASENLDLSTKSLFSLKIFVVSDGLTGNQPPQVSFKLQDGTLSHPWSTQSEIIKPIILDQWQTVEFDFLNDPFINLDQNSKPPTERKDFNRVVIQVNGENNNHPVTAYLDDLSFGAFVSTNPIYDLLVWSDDFDEEGPIDQSKWHHQTQLPNGYSWHNGEIQHYTDREENTFVEDGVLHIVGKKESYNVQGVRKQYTSARLNSKFAFKYGRIEVRAKLPSGIGTWPAIWTLGKNINEDGAYWDNEGFGTTPWPACGEIDIMEHWGDQQNFVQSAIHTTSSYGATFNKGGRILPEASSDFHTYAVTWYPEKLVFTIDDVLHYVYFPSNRDLTTWPFNEEQYILLNFAFLPNIDPDFTQDSLSIDFVRVYQESPTSVTATKNVLKFDLNASPNPLEDTTTITYILAENRDVKLLIRDINGNLVQTLVNKRQNAGKHEVIWNIGDLQSGVYLYTLDVEGRIVTKKCIVK
jgi:beta-glucanase (GH16 family)